MGNEFSKISGFQVFLKSKEVLLMPEALPRNFRSDLVFLYFSFSFDPKFKIYQFQIMKEDDQIDI